MVLVNCAEHGLNEVMISCSICSQEFWAPYDRNAKDLWEAMASAIDQVKAELSQHQLSCHDLRFEKEGAL